MYAPFSCGKDSTERQDFTLATWLSKVDFSLTPSVPFNPPTSRNPAERNSTSCCLSTWSTKSERQRHDLVSLSATTLIWKIMTRASIKLDQQNKALIAVQCVTEDNSKIWHFSRAASPLSSLAIQICDATLIPSIKGERMHILRSPTDHLRNAIRLSLEGRYNKTTNDHYTIYSLWRCIIRSNSDLSFSSDDDKVIIRLASHSC